MGLSTDRAAVIAAQLALDLDDGICHACLCFVSFAVDDGDEREIRRQVRQMTPDLWADGLDAQALAAVRKAREAGVADAGGSPASWQSARHTIPGSIRSSAALSLQKERTGTRRADSGGKDLRRLARALAGASASACQAGP